MTSPAARPASGANSLPGGAELKMPEWRRGEKKGRQHLLQSIVLIKGEF